jgi:hypothetical protein
MKKFLTIISIVLLIFPNIVFGEPISVDLSLNANDVVLSDSSSSLTPGQIVRLYATVVNLGVSDAVGQVLFYLNGSKQVGSANVSLKAGGVEDEVFVDFLVPSYEFNVSVKIVSVSPDDQNLSNNEAITVTYHVKKDTDGDGIFDDQDLDDDNDGVSDADELKNGTDPLNKDTDGDGVIDSLDVYPLDPNKSKVEVLKPVQKLKTETAKVEQLPTPTTQKQKATEFSAKTEKKTLVTGSTDSLIDKKNAEEKQIELVNDFYNSPDVELLNQVEIVGSQLNWNTFDFNFKTNIENLSTEKVAYQWNFGDGVEANKNGSHKYRSTGEYLITLKVKGPWNNDLYDSVRVRVAFWSVYNYWLWLIVLVLVLIGLLYSYDFRHRKIIEPKAEREIKQPKNRRKKSEPLE